MLNTLLILFSMLVNPPKSVYEFKTASIDGGVLDLSKFKGKKLLIVNTASKCGYTPQYDELEKLQEQYPNLVVIGYPANNFGGQEPGTNAEIQEFCKVRFGVTFPMASKVSVLGADIDPLFKYLTSGEANPELKGDIKWNFEKFLINENGKLIKRFPSKVTPLSSEITSLL